MSRPPPGKATGPVPNGDGEGPSKSHLVKCHPPAMTAEATTVPLDRLDLRDIDWVIDGGESGPRFRQHDTAWAESIAARCAAVGVAFFYMLDAGRLPGRGTAMAGRIVNAFPSPQATHQLV